MAPKPNVWGNKMVRKLRYSSVLSRNTGALGLITDHVYRMNSLYDPDFTIAGHQPLGFDQMMLSFNHYTVISAKITMRFINTGGGQVSTGIVAGALISDGSSFPYSTIEAMQEANTARWKLLGNRDGSSKGETIVMYYSARKTFGSGVLQREDLRGDAGSNPTEGSFLHVFLQNPFSSDQIVLVHTSIDYLAVFTEPRNLGQS